MEVENKCRVQKWVTRAHPYTNTLFSVDRFYAGLQFKIDIDVVHLLKEEKLNTQTQLECISVGKSKAFRFIKESCFIDFININKTSGNR